MEPTLQREEQPLLDGGNSIGFLFHLVSITITCTILFLLMKTIIDYPEPLENHFLVQPIMPEKLSVSNNSPIIVKTGFYLSNFRQFDILANNFICEGTVWFEFDSSLVSLDTISRFEFKNAEIQHVSQPKTRMVGKSTLVHYDVIVHFIGGLDYSFFPMDDHMLALILINKAVSPYEVIFEAEREAFRVNVDVKAHGWRLFYHEAITGYLQDKLENTDERMNVEYPAAQYSIFYAREGLKYTLVLMLPMLVFIIIMLTAFSYDPKKYFSSIMVANGASLSGLIAYRFVIENMSPKVGYFMLSDLFYIFFLVLQGYFF